MDFSWTTVVDIAISAFIMLFLIGHRFNQWPNRNGLQLSGKPSDYIDPFRYYTFYFIYISTFLLVAVAVYNLELAIPESLKASAGFKDILEKLDNQGWAVAALYLLALVNERHVEKWDAAWRNRLQMWARIPKAVVDMKSNLLFSDETLTPKSRWLADLHSEVRKLNLNAYWAPKIDNWEMERRDASVAWQYIRAMYVLRICKQLRVASFSAEDFNKYEERLKDLGYLLSKLEKGDDGLKKRSDELKKLYEYCVESLCKHVIKKNPSKTAQRDALNNLGFHITFYEVPHIRVLGTAFNCVVCISIVCIVTIALYLTLLDVFALSFKGSEPWFSWDRLWRWSRGSIVSYTMAIFVAIIIEKSRSTQNGQPRIMTYVIALLFSTLVSLTFFHFTNSDIQLAWVAYVSLALSMGVAALAVIRSLTKPTCKSKNEVLLSASSQAVVLGLLAGLFQIIAAISFRGGFDRITPQGMVISSLYGFLRGGVVVFIVSALIQDSIRKQLFVAQRQTPRVRFKTRVPAAVDAEPFTVTTRDISLGGLLIEPGRLLEKDQQIDLTFAFGMVRAKVRWASKKFAGLAFSEDSPNLDELRQFIRGNFGLAYA